MKPEIIDAIKRSSAVPSMPAVVTRFLEVIQQPDFEYEDLISLMSTDPGTASEILRLSNSALFGVARKITSIKQAMILLGPRRVRSLVLGRYMVESIGKIRMGELDSTYFWRRSLATAILSARFAEKVMPRLREEAFVAGLLADVGVAILAQELPKEYAPVLRLYQPQGESNLAQTELQAVGVTHAEISATVLEYWQLPELICEAVAKHQSDLAVEAEDVKLARILSSADKVGKVLCESPELDHLVERLDATMKFIGLDVQALPPILENVETDINEFADLLRIKIISSSIYALIAKAIRDYMVTQVGKE